MKAIDLGDEPRAQVDAARALMVSAEQGHKIFISAFVLLETAWVLKSKGRVASDIARAFEALLHTEGIVVSMSESAQDSFRPSSTPT